MGVYQKSRSVMVVAMGNLFARWPRALVALVAVMLGVALVAAVTTGYASARQTILDWNYSWVGHSDIHVQPIPDTIWSDPRLSGGLVERIRALPGVAGVVTRQKTQLLAASQARPDPVKIYGYGIELPTAADGTASAEGEMAVRSAGIRLEPGGRMPEPGAPGEVLIERHLAEVLGADLGDTITLLPLPETGIPAEVDVELPGWLKRLIQWRARHAEARHRFTVVGILSRPRFSYVSSWEEFQLRDLVMMSQPNLAALFAAQTEGAEALGYESVDVLLTASRPQNMVAVADAIRREVDAENERHPERTLSVLVEAAADKVRQLDRNMRLFRLISRTVAVVALLTASFIIFTTLGMGMVQRQAELGVLRCVGAGRAQVALATFAEAVPIAAVGIALGLLLGLAAVKGVIEYYHVFFTRMVISRTGLLWAGIGGLAAVLLAVAFPAYLASRVSPLAASRPQTRRMPMRLDLALGLVGMGMIAASFLARAEWVGWPTADFQILAYLLVGVPLLFLGYFLAAPLLVGTLGRALKYVSAGLLAVRPRLLDDQMQTARWRTAATFCALMVGISMLVNLRVHSESIIRGWELPTRMPPGFLYFFDMLDRERVRQVIALPDIRNPMPVSTFWVRFQDAERIDDVSAVAQFMAGPFLEFSTLVQLSFSELPPGRDPDWAIGQVSAGDSIIVTREFATRYDARIGTTLRLWRHDHATGREFAIVGIVESSTLDMAIDFLNLRDRYQNLASGTIIGSIGEANDILRGEHPPSDAPDAPTPDPSLPLLTRLLLFDFDGARTDRMADDPADPEQAGGGDQAALERIKTHLKAMNVEFFAGSLDELREMIIGEFRAVVRILQKLALWAMAIASLGVGFSMAANVHSRRRQLAVLRAIGVTRFQLARLVLAEALTIALIGSLLGIVHGLHLASNATYFDRVLFGLQPRWTLQPGVLGLAIGFAAACCLVASVFPAMRAGRTNIIAAMRQL